MIYISLSLQTKQYSKTIKRTKIEGSIPFDFLALSVLCWHSRFQSFEELLFCELKMHKQFSCLLKSLQGFMGSSSHINNFLLPRIRHQFGWLMSGWPPPLVLASLICIETNTFGGINWCEGTRLKQFACISQTWTSNSKCI